MADEDLSRIDHSPRSERRERCGAGADGDLRWVIFKGRDRFAVRTFCNLCAEEAFEAFIGTVSP